MKLGRNLRASGLAARRPVAGTARISMTRAGPLATGTSEGEVCLRTSKSGALQRQSTSAGRLDRPWLAATTNCRCPSRWEALSRPRNRRNLANIVSALSERLVEIRLAICPNIVNLQ
jgi:hypothetical protein